MGKHDWFLDMFNSVDIRVVDIVCNNAGVELTIEDGFVTGYHQVVKED